MLTVVRRWCGSTKQVLPLVCHHPTWHYTSRLATLFDVSMAIYVDRESSVGIVTCYGLGGPGIESRWWRDIPYQSGPAFGPTQPPLQGVQSH